MKNHLRDYQDARNEDPGKLPVLKPMIWEALVGADLDKDLGVAEEAVFSDFDGFLEKLHAYLSDLGDTMINDGLHIFGTPPEEGRLTEFLVQLTRVANGSVPSLRESVVRAMGYDYDYLLKNKGKIVNTPLCRTGGQVIEAAHNFCLDLVNGLAFAGFDSGRIPEILRDAQAHIPDRVPDLPQAGVETVLAYICDHLVPDIEKTTDEFDSTLAALDGAFIPPGPSGAPTRGQAHILPTGRNFYSVDPARIPSPGAWGGGAAPGGCIAGTVSFRNRGISRQCRHHRVRRAHHAVQRG